MDRSVRGFRRTLTSLVPFALHRRRSFPFTVSNGKTVDAFAAFVDRDGSHTIQVALHRCCVHGIIQSIAEEVLHAQGVLEKDGIERLADESVSRSSPSREIAYALLSTLLHIPSYCKDHAP